MGIFPEGDGIYNFARNGSAVPQGEPSTAVTQSMTTSSLARTLAGHAQVDGHVWSALGAGGSPLRNQRVSGRAMRRSGYRRMHQSKRCGLVQQRAELAAAGQPANNAGEIAFILGGPRITVPASGTGTTRIFRPASPWPGRPIPARAGSRRFLAKRTNSPSAAATALCTTTSVCPL